MAAIYVQRYLEYGKKYAQPITEMFTVINAMINDTKYDILWIVKQKAGGNHE